MPTVHGWQKGAGWGTLLLCISFPALPGSAQATQGWAGSLRRRLERPTGSYIVSTGRRARPVWACLGLGWAAQVSSLSGFWNPSAEFPALLQSFPREHPKDRKPQRSGPGSHFQSSSFSCWAQGQEESRVANMSHTWDHAAAHKSRLPLPTLCRPAAGS